MRRFSLRNIFGIHDRFLSFEHDLESIKRYHFQFGDDLKATIRDIGPSKPEPLKNVSIDKLAPFWAGPLAPDIIRWIHVPIGPGKQQDDLTHQFVQVGDNLGKRSEILRGERRLSIQSQPERYECEILNLRTLNGVQEAYDVLDLVRRWSHRDTPSDSKYLSQDKPRGKSITSLGRDLLRVKSPDWALQELAGSELTSDLGSGYPTGFRGWDFEIWPFDAKVIKQTLSSHSLFKDAILVKDPLCYIYRERIIITFSPCQGVSYIGGHLNSELEKPPTKSGKSNKFSVIPKVQDDFLFNGTHYWPSKSVEWLLVYLVTQVLSTPVSSSRVPRVQSRHSRETEIQQSRHSRETEIQQSRHSRETEIQDAYQTIVWNLKRRCQIDRGRDNPEDLALDYVACINELTELVRTFEDKKLALERLRKCCPVEEGNLRPSESGIFLSAEEMIEDALTTLENIGHLLPHLRGEMETSLATFYHFRNIDQDVLQRLSERNNRTMLVFTATTIIFLPLSFFTSYFGMNLSDITNTVHTQKYFWSVCGTIALVIVFGTFSYAMKQRLGERGGRVIQRVRGYLRRMH